MAWFKHIEYSNIIWRCPEDDSRLFRWAWHRFYVFVLPSARPAISQTSHFTITPDHHLRTDCENSVFDCWIAKWEVLWATFTISFSRAVLLPLLLRFVHRINSTGEPVRLPWQARTKPEASKRVGTENETVLGDGQLNYYDCQYRFPLATVLENRVGSSASIPYYNPPHGNRLLNYSFPLPPLP